MIILLSPAKRLQNQKIPIDLNKVTLPNFLKESGKLIKDLQTKSVVEIQNLMSLSNELAELNFVRYHNWDKKHNTTNSQAAINLFFGDAYRGLDAKTLSTENLEKLNETLLILSGLYGVLKPFDLIQDHRLEMGTKLKNTKGNDLYNFWKISVTEHINQIISERNANTIINLASNEYFKVIDKKQIKCEIITPIFKEEKSGKQATVAIFAKRARGLMTRFIVENNITNPEHIKAFDYENYTFSTELSTKNEWNFIR